MKSVRALEYRQKGTALTWVISLFFIFVMGALVIDASMLYQHKRQLQSLTNRLATEMAEEVQTCSGVAGGVDIASAATTKVKEWVSLGEVSDQVTVNYARLALMENVSKPGQFNISKIDDAEMSNAVAVALERPVNGLLYFLFDKPMLAEATARKEVVAGITVDSDILSLNTQESRLLSLVFSDILGTSGLSLDIGGISDLALAITDVDKLVSDLGLASLDEIPVSDLLLGILNNSITSGLTSSASELLNSMIGLVDGNPSITSIDVEEIIAGVHESEVPAGAAVNALGLVQSIISNLGSSLGRPIEIRVPGDEGIISDLGLSGILGLVANLEVDLELTPSPGYILASAKRDSDGHWPRASSKAVSAFIKSELLAGIGGKLEIRLDTAKAEVELYKADCALGSDNVIDELSMQTKVSAVNLDLSLEGLIGIVKVKIPSFSENGFYGEPEPPFRNINLEGYSNQDKMVSSFGGTDEVLENLTSELLTGTKVCVLFELICISVSENGLVQNILNTLVDPLLSGLLVPLVSALGIDLVPSEITLDSVGQSYTLVEEGLPNSF